MDGLLFATDQKYVEFYQDAIREGCPGTRLNLCQSGVEMIDTLFKTDVAFLLVDLAISRSGKIDDISMQELYSVRQDDRFRYLPLVLVTDLDDERFFAYNRLHCYAYYHKPLNKEVFLSDVIPCFRHAVSEHDLKEQMQALYTIKKSRSVYFVPECELVRYEKQRHKGMIITMDEEIELDIKNLSRMKRLMTSDSFVQCSRRHYVNLGFIHKVGSDNVQLRGGYGEVELSPDRREVVLRRMDEEAEKRKLRVRRDPDAEKEKKEDGGKKKRTKKKNEKER